MLCGSRLAAVVGARAAHAGVAVVAVAGEGPPEFLEDVSEDERGQFHGWRVGRVNRIISAAIAVDHEAMVR